MGQKGLTVQIAFIFFVTVLMANLNAFIDYFLHPEIPYFDKEHLIVGGITAFFTAVLLGGLILYTNRLGNVLDEHKQAEKTLQESEERYRSLVENARDVIYTTSRDGTITSLNPVFEGITGWSPAEWIGKHFSGIIHSDDLPIATGILQSVLHGETPPMFELRTLTKSGGYLVAEFMAAPRIRDGEVIGMLGVARDITERRHAEEFIRNILESIDEGFIVIDPEYRIISANKAYCKQVKMPLENIIGRHCYEISHHIYKPCCEVGENCHVRHTFDTGESRTAVHRHCDKEGSPIHVELKSYPLRDSSGKVVSVVEIVHDITEKKKLEDQLRHAQKMESIGTFAGGIAHDFNNILTAIIGYGNLIQMKMERDNPLRHNVEQIIASTERAAALTQSLLTFSRKQINNPRPINLNETVARVEKLLVRLIGEDIELRKILTHEEITVMADGGQIEQVLMNLATNARDAMPEGGNLTFETGRMELDTEFVKTHGYGKPGSYALILITDTGEGMGEKTKERIFEPFFTTKESGKGTGLGLAIVYGIVKQHNGYINVYSELGKGTTFKIYLPLTASEIREIRPAELIFPAGGTETILMAEDDSDVREITKAILEEFGYTVIAAEDGDDAIEKFIENKDEINLILLDVIMPKKNGRETCKEIKKIKPDIKVLFTSGYPADIANRNELLEEGVDFIPKPVSPTEFLKKVRDMLDKANS